jgi:peptide-methionine (S)-S-oxide reductase
VHRTRVGYTGGTLPSPTYHALGDHTEAVELEYDPDALSYDALLALFFEAHDPVRPRSVQYHSAVYVRTEAERAAALAARERRAAQLGCALHTYVQPLQTFYRAEDYHQKYTLRGYRAVLREFEGYSEQEFTDSRAAARLNGLLAGEGDGRAALREVPAMGLSPAALEELTRALGEGPGGGFCAL